MRFQTTGGQFVSAATKAEAAALAAQYGFGEIAGAAPSPAKAVKPMTLQTARRLQDLADLDGRDFPAKGNLREQEAWALISRDEEGL